MMFVLYIKIAIKILQKLDQNLTIGGILMAFFIVGYSIVSITGQ